MIVLLDEIKPEMVNNKKDFCLDVAFYKTEKRFP